MLQLRRIRSFTKNGATKKYDAPFEPDILVETHQELFDNLDKYIAMIPDYERWDCHFTQGHTAGGKTRGKNTFERQSLVVFDVDGIELSEDKSANKKFIEIFFATVPCDREKVVVNFSGHGLHFITQIPEWTDKKFFAEHFDSYNKICDDLEAAYKLAGLKFKEIDRAVFAPNKMLRLPNTLNVKKDKPKVMCRRVSGELSEQPNFLSRGKSKKAKGSTQKPNTTEPRSEKNYPKPDSTTIELECDFLRFCKADPAKVKEDQWYASLSILGRLENGAELAHEYSTGHPNYSREETDAKLVQSLEVPPRTCEDIGNRWKGCGDCKHYGKVKTPLQIRAEDHIATAEQGFYYTDDNDKRQPDYDGLVKYFQQLKPHKVNKENGNIQAFNGRKYETFYELEVKAFAGQNFKPVPNKQIQPPERIVSEFYSRVKRHNHVDQSFFDVEPGLINFWNGIFEIKTGKVLPHTPDLGFQYVLPYDYDPKALCPEFDAMMKRITCNEIDLENQLLEYVAYAVCDREYTHHKALVLVGEGANGKSTFLEVVKELVGEENYSSVGIKEMDQDTKRAMLEGKLVNISDEMPSMRMSDTDTFKKMMGGTVTIKNVWEKPSTMRCTTKMMFACNEMPATYDNSHGLHRRLDFARFNAHFDKNNVDHGIMGKIRAELPGIFNRVLVAYKRLEAQGHFTQSKNSRKEKQKYKEDNDILGTFIKDHYEWTDTWGKDDYIEAGKVMADFVQYANEMNENTKHISAKRMRTALERAIPQFDKRIGRLTHGGRGRVYYGVKPINGVPYTNGNGAADHGKGWIDEVETGLRALDSGF